jgi:Homeodomain-like domain
LLIVADDRVGLEADIAAGRLVCPRCGRGVLGGWGRARRRPVRTLAGMRWLRPRRGRCRAVSCGATHVLLPDVCLLRRCDAVEVIGAAVLLAAAGAGYRQVAEQLGRPAETVRDWLARFRGRAELIAVHFGRWVRAMDGAVLPAVAGGRLLVDAVEAIGVCTRAASLWLGRRPPWSWVSALTGGRLLWINTSPPWPSPE